ncbi:YqzE family protein [Alkalihalobacillus sp. LMS39]|uniref:YqzE family protein n=1 Tax=Alkalihalobacillus sp. LMS39 TaxID=2924032 RepID=UPI001FB34E48|nr:YqzE family protein [Alkalihalobacillus sp. LMS39]UOE95884.1 YqzE family protein [Alkalihalobacillus sp. LMS39]
MSFNDIVKYITQQFVTYVDQPSEKRKEIRQERKSSKSPMHYQMFGMIPLALSIFFKNSRSKRNK